MGDESAKRAAQEFLAAKIIEEGQTREAQLNQEAAITLGPTLWKRVASTVTSQCRDWNSVTNEQSLTCKRHSAISASCVPEGPIRWSCIMIPGRVSSSSRILLVLKMNRTQFFASWATRTAPGATLISYAAQANR